MHPLMLIAAGVALLGMLAEDEKPAPSEKPAKPAKPKGKPKAKESAEENEETPITDE